MASFSELPNEVQANIFAFVRVDKDFKACCLVCRHWRAHVAPLLWERLTTDFQPTSSKTLSTLLGSNSGILPHVRVVGLRNESLQSAESPDIELNLRLLLSGLPRNILTKFFAVQIPISLENVLCLLQSQQQIKTLGLRLRSLSVRQAAAITLRDSSWIRDFLGHIESLMLKPTEPHHIDEFRFLIENSPALKGILLSNPGKRELTGVRPIQCLLNTDESARPTNTLRLDSLNCSYISLPEPHLLTDRIDFVSLGILQLICCRHTIRFLETLATMFSLTSCNLYSLALMSSSGRRDEESSSWITAVHSLLMSFTGLEALFLDNSRVSLISANAVVHHQKTLRWLVLGTELKQIAINLPTIDLGQLRDADQRFGLRAANIEHSDLKALLDILSQHQMIHTLRILSLPTIDYGLTPNPDFHNLEGIPDAEAKLAGVVFLQFASQLMQYLARNSSNIKVLGIHPTKTFRGPSTRAPDENGHVWPRYYFKRGTITDAQGKLTTVAVPVKNPVQEMAQNTFLFD